ncbi:Uncharacterised protein [Clostridium sporogenes]|nr:Uncharacterised protein [Clostridium sporogenes]
MADRRRRAHLPAVCRRVVRRVGRAPAGRSGRWLRIRTAAAARQRARPTAGRRVRRLTRVSRRGVVPRVWHDADADPRCRARYPRTLRSVGARDRRRRGVGGRRRRCAAGAPCAYAARRARDTRYAVAVDL